MKKGEFMDEEKKSFQFLDRVYVKAPRSRRGLRIFFIVIGILILLLGLFRCLMEGFSIKAFWPYGVGPLVCFWICVKPALGSAGFQASPVSVDMEQNSMKITYPSLDREDGMGKRAETYDIANTDIQRIEFSKNNQCIKIICKPLLSVNFQDAKKRPIVNDYRQSPGLYQSTLFAPDNVRDELLSNLQRNIGIQVAYTD